MPNLHQPFLPMSMDGKTPQLEQLRIINVEPTKQQLAARHSMPEELPIFTGRPYEWPLLISSYELNEF